MVAILRWEWWSHSEYWVGHDFVKKMALKTKKDRRERLEESLAWANIEEILISIMAELKTKDVETVLTTLEKRLKVEQRWLLDVCLEDEEFRALFERLDERKQRILRWELELYIWHSLVRAERNIKFTDEVLSRVQEIITQVPAKIESAVEGISWKDDFGSYLNTLKPLKPYAVEIILRNRESLVVRPWEWNDGYLRYLQNLLENDKVPFEDYYLTWPIELSDFRELSLAWDKNPRKYPIINFLNNFNSIWLKIIKVKTK